MTEQYPKFIANKALIEASLRQLFSESAPSADSEIPKYLESVPSKKLGPFQTSDRFDYLFAAMVCGPDVEKGDPVIKEESGLGGFSLFKIGLPNKFLAPRMMKTDTSAICERPGTGETLFEGIGRDSAAIQTAKVSPKTRKFLETLTNLPISPIYRNPIDGKNTNLAKYVLQNFKYQDSAESFQKWWAENIESQMQKAFERYEIAYANVIQNFLKDNQLSDSARPSYPSISSSAPMAAFQESLFYLTLSGNMIQNLWAEKNVNSFSFWLVDKKDRSPPALMSSFVNKDPAAPFNPRILDAYKIQWHDPVLNLDKLLEPYAGNWEQQSHFPLSRVDYPRLVAQDRIVDVLRLWLYRATTGIIDSKMSLEQRRQAIQTAIQELNIEIQVFNASIQALETHFGLNNAGRRIMNLTPEQQRVARALLQGLQSAGIELAQFTRMQMMASYGFIKAF
jgi:hypothetical protein